MPTLTGVRLRVPAVLLRFYHDVDPIDVAAETHSVVAGGPGQAMVSTCCEGNNAPVTLALRASAPARLPAGWVEATDLDLDRAATASASASSSGRAGPTPRWPCCGPQTAASGLRRRRLGRLGVDRAPPQLGEHADRLVGVAAALDQLQRDVALDHRQQRLGGEPRRDV